MNLINEIKRYGKATAAFIISSVVIVLFTPNSGNFEYDFSKGKVWKYDDLYAPFDFPVYKTDAEFLNEKRLISETALKYYIADTIVTISAINDLKNDLSHHEPILKAVLAPFERIYARGIMRADEVNNKQIEVVKGINSQTYPVLELYTTTTAINYIESSLIASNLSKKNKIIADSIDFNKYVRVNLTKDDDLTAKANKRRLDLVLPTESMVDKGSKIISKNEPISESTYKELTSLKREYNQSSAKGNRYMVFLGKLIFVLGCMGAIFVLLRYFMSSMLTNNKCLYFTITLITVAVCLSLWASSFNTMYVYLVPLTFVPVYISLFFYSRPGLFIHLFVTILIANFTAFSFEFVYISSLAGITAIIGFKHAYRRWQFFLMAFLLFITYTAAYLSLKLIRDGSIVDFSKTLVIIFAINSLFIIILFQFTFIFERLFGFVSDSRLVEMSDTNQKLLRLLTETAPGTAQHVLQVANIAEAVIREIGGNHLLVRAGALYHDIGKIKNPSFFTENQISGVSPHSDISPEESAKIIIDHVSFGVELAKKHNLPEVVIDFIRTHHGLSKTYYFYSKHLEGNSINEEDVSLFTYPGPNPTTKETAVVMIADSCEAASRSLKNPDEKSINDLVDKIVRTQVSEDYLDFSDLTLNELTITKNVIKSKLKNIYHSRIEYPERK